MWKKQNIIVKLVIVNVFIFLIINIFKLIFFLLDKTIYFQEFLTFLAVPSKLHQLVTHFWTVITYMFVHEKFMHLFGNMLFLYFLGIISIRFFKEIQVFTIYIMGGLSGALLYFIGFNIFPVFTNQDFFSQLIGASASITAIVIALSVYKPKEPVHLFGLLRIELWIISVFMVIWDIASIPESNAGGHLAHLGGAVYGLVFALYYKKGVNIQNWAENIFFRIFEIGEAPVTKRKMKVIKSNLKSRDDYTFKMTQHQINEEINRILDKISDSGYKSLTKKEKDFLNKFNKKI